MAAIAGEITRSTVAGLARCTPKDVERAGEAVRRAAHGRIHVFCATSKIHREFKLKKAWDICNCALTCCTRRALALDGADGSLTVLRFNRPWAWRGVFTFLVVFMKTPLLSPEPMPEEGIEPTLSCENRILNPARLPVPPLRRSAQHGL